MSQVPLGISLAGGLFWGSTRGSRLVVRRYDAGAGHRVAV